MVRWVNDPHSSITTPTHRAQWVIFTLQTKVNLKTQLMIVFQLDPLWYCCLTTVFVASGNNLLGSSWTRQLRLGNLTPTQHRGQHDLTSHSESSTAHCSTVPIYPISSYPKGYFSSEEVKPLPESPTSAIKRQTWSWWLEHCTITVR